MVHPMLSVTQLASMDLKNYSDSNDVDTYAMALSQWIEQHNMKQFNFTQLKKTHMYLDHLNEDKFSSAEVTCKNDIVHIDHVVSTPNFYAPHLNTTQQA